eukprot:UN03744
MSGTCEGLAHVKDILQKFYRRGSKLRDFRHEQWYSSNTQAVFKQFPKKIEDIVDKWLEARKKGISLWRNGRIDNVYRSDFEEWHQQGEMSLMT